MYNVINVYDVYIYKKVIFVILKIISILHFSEYYIYVVDCLTMY